MDKMREEFEVWCDEQGYVSDKYISDDCGDKFKHLVGEYVISGTRFLWAAWKASRAAMCVELPDNLDGEYYADGWNACLMCVEDKMKDAGVSCK